MRQRFFPGSRSRRTAAVVRRRAPSLEFLENRIVLTQLAYGLFDSGVDANGNALTTVGSQDPHWTLPVTQTGTNGMNAVTASLASGWVPNSATDAWISPTSSDEAAPGLYTYHTTFNVPSVGGGVSLTGSLTGADDVVDFQINGASTGYSRTSAYTGFLPFRVNGGVSVGTNTLDVIVRNGPGNPNATGFHIKSLVLNYLPILTVDHSVETTASGGTVTNSGSFDDPDASDNVTITSSRGTITQNGAHSGTFTYSESNVTTGGMVTVTATDSRGATRTQPFTTNIATATPTVTNPASQVSVNTSTYNIQGTAAVQSLVQVYDDANKDGVLDAGDTVVASQQLAGGGTTFSIAAPLTSKAVNDFLVTATAPSNSESNAMVVLAITQDAIAPSAPTVITPSAPESVKAATAIVTGTAEAGALVPDLPGRRGRGQPATGRRCDELLDRRAADRQRRQRLPGDRQRRGGQRVGDGGGAHDHGGLGGSSRDDRDRPGGRHDGRCFDRHAQRDGRGRQPGPDLPGRGGGRLSAVGPGADLLYAFRKVHAFWLT